MNCSICIEPLENFEELECGHSYHSKCIARWFMTQPTCPTCRAQFTTLSIKKILDRNGYVMDDTMSISGYGSDEEFSDFENAIRRGDTETVLEMMRNGQNVQQSSPMSSWEPFELACAIGRHQIVKKMLETGANPNKTSIFGTKPLWHAIVNRHCTVIELLVQHGARINARICSHGYTPLVAAIVVIRPEEEALRIVQALLKNGARTSVKCAQKLLPIWYARGLQCNRIVDKLALQTR